MNIQKKKPSTADELAIAWRKYHFTYKLPIKITQVQYLDSFLYTHGITKTRWGLLQ